ncbi:Hemolymph lipopolysaccharide-binding protein [Eumeta japonica]|uniref:Hemolymph lipopolysaccharide-binding protein n=1 Tax=Eumeta variegata TaxID=151549 RepID=A0A4C1UFY2_EUMVA|nr:Hemolymph lipopolysaccharide-binding protein [Eumeta japonica]
MVIFVVLAAASIASLSTAVPQFRKDYKYVVEHNAFYKAHLFPRSWYDALKYCDMEGSTLVYPASAEEVSLITEMMGDHFWVAAHDLLGRGAFLDVKGNDISTQCEHTCWNTGTLDHSMGADCVKMNTYGTIYNFDCKTSLPFVCKKLAQNITYNDACDTWDEDFNFNLFAAAETPSPSNDLFLLDREASKFVEVRAVAPLTAALGTNGLAFFANHAAFIAIYYFKFISAYFVNNDHKSCYKFHTTPKTWTDAFLTCHAEQSYLAIIDDKEEADFITKGVKAVAEDVRGDYVKDFIAVGYHDKFEEGNYITLKGQKLDTVYNEWDKGEPNNMYGQEDCGTIKTNGLLNDFNCDTQRILFVCERDLAGKDWNEIY